MQIAASKEASDMHQQTPPLTGPDRVSARSSPAIGGQDITLLREGNHTRLYWKLGCHLHATGARFAVWAPNARSVSVIGDFNDWNADADLARVRRDGSGIWELDVLRVAAGQRYKFAVFTREGARLDKADPFATRAELAPASSASRTSN
jgi:1,4-alpha-glucan branching enzyme